jgi:hypothetical protein
MGPGVGRERIRPRGLAHILRPGSGAAEATAVLKRLFSRASERVLLVPRSSAKLIMNTKYLDDRTDTTTTPLSNSAQLMRQRLILLDHELIFCNTFLKILQVSRQNSNGSERNSANVLGVDRSWDVLQI